MESSTRGDTEMTGLCGGHRFAEKGARGSGAAIWCSPSPSPPLLSKAPRADRHTDSRTHTSASWAALGMNWLQQSTATVAKPVRYWMKEVRDRYGVQILTQPPSEQKNEARQSE